MTSNAIYFRPQISEYQLYNSEKTIDKFDTSLLSNNTFSHFDVNFSQASMFIN